MFNVIFIHHKFISRRWFNQNTWWYSMEINFFVHYDGVQCFFLCLLKLLGFEYFLSHSLHWYCFSPECFTKCFLTSANVINFLLQNVHMKTLTFSWIFVCRDRLEFSENILSQYLHLNGRRTSGSDACVRRCAFKWCESINDFLQTLHSNGFSSEIIMRLASRLETW